MEKRYKVCPKCGARLVVSYVVIGERHHNVNMRTGKACKKILLEEIKESVDAEPYLSCSNCSWAIQAENFN